VTIIRKRLQNYTSVIFKLYKVATSLLIKVGEINYLFIDKIYTNFLPLYNGGGKEEAIIGILFELRFLFFSLLSSAFLSLFPFLLLGRGLLIGRYDHKHSETRSRDYIAAHETLQFCRPFSCRGTT